MIRTVYWIGALLILYLGPRLAAEEDPTPRIGESEHVFALADTNQDIRGLAVDDQSPNGTRLFALDRSGSIYVYPLGPENCDATSPLEIQQAYSLKTGSNENQLASPRGLAYAVEDGHDVFYYLNWNSSRDGLVSQLWRYVPDTDSRSCIDLSLSMFRIGDREVFDLAYDRGRIYISFDASGYSDRNRRVLRGILRLDWGRAPEASSTAAFPADTGIVPSVPKLYEALTRFAGTTARLQSVRHLPDSGIAASRGLACMALGGTDYLWATVGNDHIYCAEARTGRGLFYFDRPQSMDRSRGCWGIAFGDDALWVSENVPGADRIHRVNVTKNLDAPLLGPRTPRHLIMTIETRPEPQTESPGMVAHNYSRPYRHDQMPNQGIWPETETLVDLSKAPNATLKNLTYSPAGDESSCQITPRVEYAEAPPRKYASRYEIDAWTNSYKKFVYPHRVNDQRQALKGTHYLADDPILYNLKDTRTYRSFIQRVQAHIQAKYGIEADMRHPYWAARNIVEYIQDHYYYPSRPKKKPATVDYDRHHYDANPGNLKIELSERPYDQSQIIACSGTSVMVTGALRFLKIPARWLGTGTQEGPQAWDGNHNGLLDADETAPSTNGHRYTQVWLGNHYGWICFDATPSKPDFNDYDPPPPFQSQWRYMERSASGHRLPKRIVFNVGSACYRPLYRDFEYDAQLAEDNNCGGDQRYNLQAQFEKPEAWRLGHTKIMLKNLCFITDIGLSGPKQETRVSWQLEGAWDRIPDATVSIFLQKKNPDPSRARNIATLATAVPSGAQNVTVNLSKYSGDHFRILIRRDGDPETGGVSDIFGLD